MADAESNSGSRDKPATVRLSTGNWITLCGMVLGIMGTILASWYGLTQKVFANETQIKHESVTRKEGDQALAEQLRSVMNQMQSLADKVGQQTEQQAAAMNQINLSIGRLEGKMDSIGRD